MNIPDDELEPRFVGVPQVQRALGLSRSTIYEMIQDGRLASVHVGPRRLVAVHEVDRFADELEATALVMTGSLPDDVKHLSWAAERLGIGVSTVYRLAASGEIPGRVQGRGSMEGEHGQVPDARSTVRRRDCPKTRKTPTLHGRRIQFIPNDRNEHDDSRTGAVMRAPTVHISDSLRKLVAASFKPSELRHLAAIQDAESPQRRCSASPPGRPEHRGVGRHDRLGEDANHWLVAPAYRVGAREDMSLADPATEAAFAKIADRPPPWEPPFYHGRRGTGPRMVSTRADQITPSRPTWMWDRWLSAGAVAPSGRSSGWWEVDVCSMVDRPDHDRTSLIPTIPPIGNPRTLPPCPWKRPTIASLPACTPLEPTWPELRS